MLNNIGLLMVLNGLMAMAISHRGQALSVSWKRHRLQVTAFNQLSERP
jgi:hypothetical protein